MPRLPKDYSKGLMYKLCCKDTSIKEIYVGSSTNFTQRKKSHKSCCNNPIATQYNLKVYQFIRENGGWDNWDMVLIEFYPCGGELELGRREDYWKQELQASLNSRTPPTYETKQEWYVGNKEERIKKSKEYYEKNKEERGKKSKEYNQANKEKILEYGKKYREQRKEKITCECGKVICRSSKSYHEKSKKHISILEKRSLSGQGIPEILS